jgi:putative endonuclease
MTDLRLNRGKQGEEQACNYLVSLGYEILERNWKFEKFEIDIICKYQQELVFVEVKHRIEIEPAIARFAVSKAQQKSIAKAANVYIEKVDFSLNSRFDVIMITQLPMKVVI